jgi:ribose transport system substrate-binding protein
MKKPTINTILMCIIFLSLVLPGCSKKDSDVETKTIAFITNNTADFWIIAQRGCEKAQTELPDYKIDFRLTSDATPAEQRRIIDDLLARNVSGIAISPIDPKNQKPFIDHLAGQITVITCDSDIPDSKRLCYIGTDNVAAGRQAGQLIKEVLPGGGKIMLFVGKRDVQNAKERIQGIEEILEGSNVEIIDVRTDNTDQVQAKSNVADTLVKYPDLACCVGLWSYNGPAILNAVSDAGKLGKIKIVTFDEESETLAGVRDGHIYGTVVQQPFEFGYQSMKMLARIIEGDTSNIPPDGQIIVPTLIIKQQDAPAFIEKMKKLLGR